MRKAKLLSTVAFALLFGAGAASAQGMSKDTPERAPASQQNAPAEKVAPSMKNGEHKAPQTTGQATPDAKSGKGKETTGQATSDKARETNGQGTSDKLNKSDKTKETTGQSPKSEKSDMNQRGPGGASQESNPASGGVNNKSRTESNPSATPSNR